MRRWAGFWMRFSSVSSMGRVAIRLAGAFSPPCKVRRYLACLSTTGYFAPTAAIYCRRLTMGKNVFIGDRVMIYERGGGEVTLGDRIFIHQDTIIEVGQGGRIFIGADTQIQPRCHLSAYKGSLTIGGNVLVSPNCAFYPYDHGTQAGQSIQKQPLRTKGGIVVEDDVWLGTGVIVLDGVRIGRGAVMGAGAVVTSFMPEGVIAVGKPARVIGMRPASVIRPHASRV
jgi:acetyltransferase-like isoleucine patch superfamily enzyme